jgi:hypothetical protein
MKRRAPKFFMYLAGVTASLYLLSGCSGSSAPQAASPLGEVKPDASLTVHVHNAWPHNTTAFTEKGCTFLSPSSFNLGPGDSQDMTGTVTECSDFTVTDIWGTEGIYPETTCGLQIQLPSLTYSILTPQPSGNDTDCSYVQNVDGSVTFTYNILPPAGRRHRI